jgi:hypothetical protein
VLLPIDNRVDFHPEFFMMWTDGISDIPGGNGLRRVSIAFSLGAKAGRMKMCPAEGMVGDG